MGAMMNPTHPTHRRLFALLALSGIGLASHATTIATKDFVKHQGRGVNLGNLLEAPSEGAWGVTLKKTDLELIASKGFQNVRIPIRWDGKGVGSATWDRVSRIDTFPVDERFFARVDSAIAWARQNRLLVLINDHHHDSLFKNFAHERPRFISIWKQIANRYKDLPTDSVAFEILNEPNTQVTVDAWNSLLDTTLKTIRATNPSRPVVIGTANWGGLSGLSGLKLPTNDSNLILTIHYYEPFSFTHQGADWVDPIPPVGTEWKGTYYEKLAVRQAMDAIADYAKPRDLPVFIGEFGAYSTADSASRGRWASHCARLFESYGFSWAWWEFKAGFGVYNEASGTWNQTLMGALLSNDTSILAKGEPPEGGTDLVSNGVFASKQDWSFSASQGTTKFTIDTARAKFVISAAATDAWGIQLIQTPVTITAGLTHVLQFDAWASSPRAIDGGLGMSDDPWTGYASAAAGLSSTHKTFFTSFVPALTDENARIYFNLGPDTGTVYIDNVKLLVWPANTSVIPSAQRLHTAPVRWNGTGLTWMASERPTLEWVVSPSGHRAARLDWHATESGWTASLVQLGAGIWIAKGQGRSLLFTTTSH